MIRSIYKRVFDTDFNKTNAEHRRNMQSLCYLLTCLGVLDCDKYHFMWVNGKQSKSGPIAEIAEAPISSIKEGI